MRFLQVGSTMLKTIKGLMAGQKPANPRNTSVTATLVRHPLSRLTAGYRYLQFLVLHYDSYGFSLLISFTLLQKWLRCGSSCTSMQTDNSRYLTNDCQVLGYF